MKWFKHFAFLFCCYQYALCSKTPCVIELKCMECLPDNMPLVMSHRTNNGTVVAASGDEVTLSCGAGRLLAYPLLSTLTTRCEDGRYRVVSDGQLRHLLELGCQESIFEDVLHTVANCAQPLQGRAYQLQESSQIIQHVATVCYDEDRGITIFAHVIAGRPLHLPPHDHQNTPLSLLGNFNQMFDQSTRNTAEKLFSNVGRMNGRLREIFKHDGITFADQSLTVAELLSSRYFDDQTMRVADFASNKFAAWGSVATGNLDHVQADIAKFAKISRPHATLDIYTGTHGVASIKTERSREKIYLGAERFPSPEYVWSVIHDKASKRALAVIVLNDPFVSVSEIREAVFCESLCNRVVWLHNTRHHRNYETPIYGLTFCCAVHNITSVVSEMPKNILADVPEGNDGLLTNYILAEPLN